MHLPIVTACFVTASTMAQTAPVAKEIQASEAITDVTVFRQRASVTRTATIDVQTGVWKIAFDELPTAIMEDSIQAKASEGLKVVDLEYQVVPATESSSDQVRQLADQLQDLQDEMSGTQNTLEVVQAKIVFLNSIAERGSEDAARDVGTTALDTSVIEDQLTFLGDQMTTLLETKLAIQREMKDLKDKENVLKRRIQNIGSSRNEKPQVVVTFVASQPAQGTLKLTYLVNRASWLPVYSVRANFDESTIGIEYDAIIVQTTGEDWNDVKMTLSTAQPTQASEPPTINPFFVDIYVPAPPAARARGSAGRPMPPADSRNAELDLEMAVESAALEKFYSHATIDGSGSAVTFELPRQLDIASGSDQQQRTRIATLQNKISYIHIAIPLLTEEVYMKGEMENTSDFQFLPGTASIFVGNDYVGQSQIGAVAPSSTYELYFGVDPAIRASRTLLEKRTDNTGLFGGGLETTYNVRIEIENGSQQPVDLELWDRWPVSRSSDITVTMSEIDPQLSTNKNYVETQEPMGLLRWDLLVPANATGTTAKIVKYRYTINRGKDIETTPLP